MTPEEFNSMKTGELARVDGSLHMVATKVCCPIPNDGFHFWLRNWDGKLINLWPADANRVTEIIR